MYEIRDVRLRLRRWFPPICVTFLFFVFLLAESARAEVEFWSNAFKGTIGGDGTWSEVHARTVADVNGDGRADIVGFANNGVHVALSNGEEFENPKLWVSAFGRLNAGAGDWHHEYHPRYLADVNRDGKADIVGFADAGVFVSLSSGASFDVPRRWVAAFGRKNKGAGDWHHRYHPKFLADVDGDGRADIVGFANAGVVVSFSTGVNFTAPSLVLKSFGRDKSAGDWSLSHFRTVADVNGDGRADIVGFANNGVYVSLSKGRVFSTPQSWLDFFGKNASAGNWEFANLSPQIIDYDSDGIKDIVAFGGGPSHSGVFISLSTGSNFQKPNRIRYGCANPKLSTYCVYPDESLFYAFLFDYNGDGRAELVHSNQDSVWLQNLADNRTSTKLITTRVNHVIKLPKPYDRSAQFADVTGDGKPDLIWFLQDGVRVIKSDNMQVD